MECGNVVKCFCKSKSMNICLFSSQRANVSLCSLRLPWSAMGTVLNKENQVGYKLPKWGELVISHQGAEDPPPTQVGYQAWSNGICVRKVDLVKRMVDGFDTSISTSIDIITGIRILKWIEGSQNCIKVMIIVILTISKAIAWYRARGPLADLDTCHKKLFGVVADINHKYWVGLTDNTIPTCHWKSICACSLQRFYYLWHECMEKVC